MTRCSRLLLPQGLEACQHGLHRLARGEDFCGELRHLELADSLAHRAAGTRAGFIALLVAAPGDLAVELQDTREGVGPVLAPRGLEACDQSVDLSLASVGTSSGYGVWGDTCSACSSSLIRCHRACRAFPSRGSILESAFNRISRCSRSSQTSQVHGI